MYSKTPIIIVLCIIIFILLICLIRCKNTDKFCQCNGIGYKKSLSPEHLKRLYAENKLTEYTIPKKGYPIYIEGNLI